MAPSQIIKFSNIVSLDINSGNNLYEVKVAFIGQNNERYVYYFSQLQGQQGQWRIEKLPMGQGAQ